MRHSGPSRRAAGPARAGRRGLAALAAAAAFGYAAIGAPAVAATTSAAPSRVVEVTVFTDRAEVIREARVDLPAGASTVEFAGLPWRVEPDSLRVTARGVGAVLGAVELRERADEPAETPEYAAALAEVRRLEMEIAAADGDEATAKELREFLGAIGTATAKRESDRLVDGKPDPNSIQAIYGLLKANFGALSKDSVERAERRKKLLKDLEVARAKLAAARPATSIRTRTATVEVEAKTAGPLTLRLAYVAPGASWRPSYRASLDAASGAIALTSEAVVRQATGEDWPGVALRLSTAAPARGVDPPVLSSLLLRPIELYAMKAARIGAVMPQAAPAPPEAMEMRPADAEGGSAGDVAEEAERAEAGVVHSAYNVAFEVAGKSDVPADGADHRVGLRSESLEGKVAYRTVPMLNPSAYLVAKTKAPGAYPLLAGTVRVFAGGAFLGSYALPETAPGSEVTLPFGVDNRIAVERVPLPQDRQQTGIFGKEKRIAYAFRTTVENLRDQRISIVLEDRVPVSEDERIKVELDEATSPGSKSVEDRPGILEWALDLAPKEKREITLAYVVRYPRELNVPGAE